MGKGHSAKPYFRDHMEAGRRPAANEPVMNPIKAAKLERANKAAARAQKSGAPLPNSKPEKKSAQTSSTKSDRPLDGEGRPYITLVQFLKTINAVTTGGAGKHLVRAGGMKVNGSEEIRPARKLHAGDTVTVAGKNYTVVLK
jgi:ribosome-associated protein YbcJ (S4-like RNA binding protein)